MGRYAPAVRQCPAWACSPTAIRQDGQIPAPSWCYGGVPQGAQTASLSKSPQPHLGSWWGGGCFHCHTWFEVSPPCPPPPHLLALSLNLDSAPAKEHRKAAAASLMPQTQRAKLAPDSGNPAPPPPRHLTALGSLGDVALILGTEPFGDSRPQGPKGTQAGGPDMAATPKCRGFAGWLLRAGSTASLLCPCWSGSGQSPGLPGRSHGFPHAQGQPAPPIHSAPSTSIAWSCCCLRDCGGLGAQCLWRPLVGKRLGGRITVSSRGRVPSREVIQAQSGQERAVS